MSPDETHQTPDPEDLPSTSEPRPEDGSVFEVPAPDIDGYTILDKLGEAGQGQVWRAIQLSTKRQVALKIPRVSFLHSKKVLARFEREVELAASLKHPNIVPIHDSGLYKGNYYLVMDLIEGVHLDEYVRQKGLSEKQILELMQTVCQAVQYAHQNGIIHRDLKPSNILVTADGTPYVLDFGLARHLTGDDAFQTITMDGQVIGTPAYMSPEQAAGLLDKVDTRSDVYSLGVILYQLLTGDFPHDLSGSRQEILTRIAEGKIRYPRSIKKNIGKELEAILIKALACEPQDRYQSVEAFQNDLQSFCHNDPIRAIYPSQLYLVRKYINRHRVAVAVVVLIFTILTGTLVTIMRLYENARDESEGRRRMLYFNRIALAESKYRNNDISALQDTLLLCPVDLREWEWYRLWYISDRSIMTLRGHDYPVDKVAFTNDGKYIFSRSSDKTIIIWCADTGKEMMTLRTIPVTLSMDGRHYGSDHEDVIFVNLAATLWVTKIPVINEIYLSSFAFSIDGKQVTWKDINENDVTMTIDHWAQFMNFAEDHLVLSAQVYWGSKRTISGIYNKRILSWNARTGGEIVLLRELQRGDKTDIRCQNELFRLTFYGTTWLLYNDKYIYAGSHLDLSGIDAPPWIDNHIVMPDAIITLLPLHNYGPNGRKTELLSLIGHKGKILAASFSPDGKRVISGSKDNTVKVWDVEYSSEIHRIEKATEYWATNAAISRNNRLLGLGFDDGRIVVWDIHTGEDVRIFKPHKEWVYALCFSQDCKQMISGGRDHTIKIWDIVSGDEIRTLRYNNSEITSLVSSPDGKSIAAGFRDGIVTIWDADTGGIYRTFNGHTPNMEIKVYYFHNGKLLISCSEDQIIVWEVLSGKKITTIHEDNSRMSHWSFSTDNKRVVSVVNDNQVVVWDIIKGIKLRTFNEMNNIGSLAISPNGNRVFTCSSDGMIKIGDVTTGTEVMTLRGPGPDVLSLSCSSDGKQINHISPNGHVWIWRGTNPGDE